jgi:glycosyltransferase involved in cell wall biosynthesis
VGAVVTVGSGGRDAWSSERPGSRLDVRHLPDATRTIDRTIDRVAIVVPARNEAAHVATAIDALGAAIAEVPPEIEIALCVVDDGSTDGTGDVARAALAALGPGAPVVRTVGRVEVGSAALARRLGFAVATGDWTAAERTWLLSTDADSRVRHDWIVRHLEYAEHGVAAVAGVVDLLDDDETAEFAVRWRSDYGSTIAADRTHPHAHATNLGVRLDAYRAVGGFRPCDGAEDTDLWRRLHEAGFEPVADASIVVDTSGRRAGRVRDGFAFALSRLYPSAVAVAQKVAGRANDVRVAG